MGRLTLFLFIVTAVLVWDLTSATSIHSGQCPPKFKVYNNKPVCHTDADCQKYGKICCPNQYNTKSCTDRAPYLKMYFKEKAQFASNKPVHGPGVYCNGVKCMPWEVCKPDSYTKKLKCQLP